MGSAILLSRYLQYSSPTIHPRTNSHCKITATTQIAITVTTKSTHLIVSLSVSIFSVPPLTLIAMPSYDPTEFLHPAYEQGCYLHDPYAIVCEQPMVELPQESKKRRGRAISYRRKHKRAR